jgi:hypothetical protein
MRLTPAVIKTEFNFTFGSGRRVAAIKIYGMAFGD